MDRAASDGEANALPPESAIPTGWLSEFELQQEARDVERLAGDVKLINELVIAGYDGPLWDRFVDALVRYGYQVIRAWLMSGLIFQRCHEKGIGRFLHPTRPRLSTMDVDDITQDTVVAAVNAFRDEVLRPGHWDHRKGASLKTFFIGQCLWRFVTIYRRFATEIETRLAAETMTPNLTEKMRLGSSSTDPADAAVTALDLADVRKLVRASKTHATLALIEEGYTQAEISEMLGVTEKAIESLLYRHRNYLRQGGIAT